MPAESRPAGKLPLPTDCNWPTLTAERPTINGGHAIHSRRRQLGCPLYVALLPEVAGHWSALDDPLQSAAVFSAIGT